MISVIIPTYREPEYLDLCLKSCIEGQINENEIIVVVDGFYEENKEILEKYKNKINTIVIEHNQGLPRATNIGVYNATNDWILIVNDDNVFDKEWDRKLKEWMNLYIDEYELEVVISPNQIEPYPSIFKQFLIINCGQDPETFDLEIFWDISKVNSKEFKFRNDEGGTLPIFMKKKNYMRVGGWDENYPSNGLVADWDFFHKCKISNMILIRDYNLNFYHFVSKATPQTPEQTQNRRDEEIIGHEYAKYKWGKYLTHNLL